MKRKIVKLTGYEANVLLYLFDDHFAVDSRGKVTNTHGYGKPFLQDLRDRLMAGHEHSMGDEA